MKKALFASAILILFLSYCACSQERNKKTEEEITTPEQDVTVKTTRDSRPNILLVVVDDMGFSDVGAFGSEIRTPNIDAIAEAGIRVTNFCVGPTCAPTRSMLMSGNDNHLAGLGNQAEGRTPNQMGQPGYEGYLSDRVVSFASLLKDSGYHTYMAGKWHLGELPEHDPYHRGFERAFALLEGGASHFDDEWMMYANYTPTYREDGERVHLPSGFYSSEFYADKIIEYIDSNDDGQPFFAYLAFTAPHDPLHVPDDWLDKYKGRYDKGWDALRAERLERMKKISIVSEDTQLSHRLPMLPEWNSMDPEAQKFEARRMELYAAMLENMDFHLGRLIIHLKNKSLLENTLIVFFSDNGANAFDMDSYPETTKEWVERNSDNRFSNWGRRGSRIAQGMGWAVASNTPLRYFKAMNSEGGIRSPLIISGPGIARTGEILPTFTHVMDIAPTFLEVAGASYPTEYSGHEVSPMMGKSLLPFIQGKVDVVREDSEAVCWELLGFRAVRQGRWKATWLPKPFGLSDWELFDLETDISERNNLAETNPEKLRELIQIWEKYAESVELIMPDPPVQLGNG